MKGMALIRVDREKCVKDGVCVEACPIGILSLDAAKGPEVRSGMGRFCVGCGHCVAVCEQGALDNVRNPLAQQTPLERFPVLDPRTAETFLRSRRSIRCYKSDPVPKEVLLQLLEITRYAPSGHNSQGISYLVVEGEEPLNRMRQIVLDWMGEMIRSRPEVAKQLHFAGIVKAHERGEDRILRGAPQVIVANSSVDLRAAPVSTTLALEYLELYATTLGLGTCWAGYAQFCAQQSPALPQFLALPQDRVVTGIMMVGYPRQVFYRLPTRNPLEVSWFGENAAAERQESDTV